MCIWISESAPNRSMHIMKKKQNRTAEVRECKQVARFKELSAYGLVERHTFEEVTQNKNQTTKQQTAKLKR